jgi:8-oxo-dGTP diphosphatase
MKNIPVACAVIKKNGKVLATQRSESMSMPLKWEFPGGKIDNGESPEECLKRELMEELSIEVDVGQPLPQTTYQYPDFSVTLFPFICTITGGRLTLHEHKTFAWMPPDKLHSLDWTEADSQLLMYNHL